MKISTDIQILCLGVLVVSSFISGDMTSQSFLLDKGTSHHHPIFIPGNPPKLKENNILCLKTSFPSQIRVTLYFYDCSNPLVDRFVEILLKCASTSDYNVVTRNS